MGVRVNSSLTPLIRLIEVVIEADPKDDAYELDGSRHSVADQPQTRREPVN